MGNIVSKGNNGRDLTDGILSTKPEHIRFYLYSDPFSGCKGLSLGDLRSLRATAFDASKDLKVIIHGHVTTSCDEYPQNVKNAYLAKYKESSKNVIIVDWSKLGLPEAIAWNTLLYPTLINNVRTVGEHTGQLILWLRDELGLNLDNVHVIGHSMGCHIAGWAGNWVKKTAGRQLGRISALDPSGPLFYYNMATRRLNKEDAEFVDAYHTNALLLGAALSVGKVDFYVSSGHGQPDCPTGFAGTWSYARIHQLFTQTILDGPRNLNVGVKFTDYQARRGFLVGSCDQNLVFGEHCRSSSRGKFYADVYL